MFNHPRKSHLLQIYEILNRRKTLSHSDISYLYNFKKGYQGEVIFSKAIKKYIDPTHHKIFDLNLTVGGSSSQYDALLFTKNALLHFEIKNQSGDYYIKDGNWYHLSSNKQINDPTHQTMRANRLIKKFLNQHQISLEVKSFTVFVHPQFHLYYAPINRQIIFPNQIKHFLENLNQTTSKNYTHTDIYKLLLDSHIKKLPHEILPEYTYGELKKGIFCGNCNKELTYSSGKYIQCEFCQSISTVLDIIMKHTYDFLNLFPDKKITVNNIYLWLGQSFSKEIIRNKLKQKLKFVANGKYSYYKFIKP